MEEQRQSPAEAVDPADVAIAVEEGRRRRRRRLLVAAAVIIALVGYVLSPGLFVLLFTRGLLSSEVTTVWEFLLWPLHEAYVNIPIVRVFYDGYFELMGVNP